MACGGGWMLGYLKAAIGCPSVTFRSSWAEHDPLSLAAEVHFGDHPGMVVHQINLETKFHKARRTVVTCSRVCFDTRCREFHLGDDSGCFPLRFAFPRAGVAQRRVVCLDCLPSGSKHGCSSRDQAPGLRNVFRSLPALRQGALLRSSRQHGVHSTEGLHGGK